MGERARHRLTAVGAGVALLAISGCSPGEDAAAGPSPSASDVPGITAGPGGDEPGVDAPSVDPRIGSVTVTATQEVAASLAVPWEAHFLSDGSALVTERDTGRIQHVDAGTATALTGPGADALAQTVDATGEAGLLGIATLPADESVVYVYLTRGDGNAVVRMAIDGTELSEPTDVITGIPKAPNHDGGRIAFGPDGHLYVATGDAAQPQLAQERESLAGKILRVVADGTEADGSVPADNPFDDLVWSMGHRNVQGLAWLPDGTMVASEFGQADADELNLIEPGANYGWPEVEGLIGAPDGTELAQTVDGFTYPIAEWRPTAAASPSGIAATEAGVFVAALRGEALFWVPYASGEGFGEPQTVLDGVGRVRAAVTDADGALYVLTNNTDGRGSPREGDDRLLRLDLETSP